MGPWGQEEKEDLGKDEKKGGWVGQSEMVTEDEGRTSQSQVWSAGLLLHRKSSIWFWKTFPNLLLGGVPVGEVWESLGYATRKRGSHTFTRSHIKKVKKQVNLILITFYCQFNMRSI